MKIDRSRVRKTTSDVPLECQHLIERLQACSRTELLEELSKISTWTFGKSELFHWATVLDVFDKLLGEAATRSEDNQWSLSCDTVYDESDKKLLLWVLHFTTLLIEHSFSRHLYNSMEHLLVLLESNDMSVVIGVLNLLYMFSKRSNFITRLKSEEKTQLISRLSHLAESWGGRENGFGLADCCNPKKKIPLSATTLHVEFHREEQDIRIDKLPNIIHIEHVDKIHKTSAEIMKSLVSMYYIPEDKMMWLFTHVRLAHHFYDYRTRLLCVQAKLQALSVLVYSNAIPDSPHTLLYGGLLEELVELVELQDAHLVEIRAASLRTLTAIIHLDRNPHIPKKPGSRLSSIIDVTGAGHYHGFLPVLVRNCISTLTNTGQKGGPPTTDMFANMEGHSLTETSTSHITMTSDGSSANTANQSKFPLPLATALFSFLYHLASYEAGGEALVSCGMMESLLEVINWHGVELEHITFVTRAVRVIDLITNIDMQAFQTHGGLQSFISRLDIEVQFCAKDQLYEVRNLCTENTNEEESSPGPSTSENPDDEDTQSVGLEYIATNQYKYCLPQRAALLKSMLNFLKKALQDTIFSDTIRHLMEGLLPNSLKNIIANAEYYGPSLFLLATDVVTVYVYQEPTLLSSLQDNGLTSVILHSLLVKDVPPTREVLGSLPNVFSALCLNNRGLRAFVKCKPFEKIFRVLLLPNYLTAMKRRRSSEPLADTACNLGNAMDELMRHQPSLKNDAILALIKLLQELIHLGTDPKYICWRPHNKAEVTPSINLHISPNNEGSSDEEDEEEEDASTSSQNPQNDFQVNSERVPIALIDYILNIMKLIDAILSNNSTDDHCREFVNQGGLTPLLKILGLPNLPVDCPVTNPAQAVATVCKSILNLAHEPKLFKEGLSQLGEVLNSLKPLYSTLDVPGTSKLLRELISTPNPEVAFNTASATPLLHAMGAAHGYIIMFVHVCRSGQSEIRNLSLHHWGSNEGLCVLKGLADLYTALVWESTLLLAYCSDDLIPPDGDFTREDIEKLNAFFDKCEGKNSATFSDSPGNVASAMEALSTSSTSSMEVDPEQSGLRSQSQNLKYIKPLLGASSRLGRALAELFGLLVKLCVGSPVRQRRGQNIVAAPSLPTPYARNVATALNVLLADGLNTDRLPPCPIPKCRITFLICSVGFTSPMLFDEKRHPYHLMLKKFVDLGGQATFFEAFKWALKVGGCSTFSDGTSRWYQEAISTGFTEGIGGFLDAWLALLEKMTNPKAILESPHAINNQTAQNPFKGYNFDAFKYLMQVHKLAFYSIMMIWGKAPVDIYGVRMSESILTILKHILKGEMIIKEHLKTDPKPEVVSSQASAPSNDDIGFDNLEQLMDMGFSREHALDALLSTGSLELATDYLLSNPPYCRGNQTGMDIDIEDDQVMQAIAISLGCGNASEKPKSEDADEPLSGALIDQFTNNAFEDCLQLMIHIPDTVHKVCELLVTIMHRNGTAFRDNILEKLLQEILHCSQQILTAFDTKESEVPYKFFLDSDTCNRFTHYTHLYVLFFQVTSYFEMRIPCALVIHNSNLIDNIVRMLIKIQPKLRSHRKKCGEPKWLSRCILLLDALLKVATCSKQKRQMHLSTTRLWKWFDLITGRWTPYSNSNNKLINDAYWNGESSVRVTCGRKRYTVHFANMLQINDESGNNRPISMTLLNATHPSVANIDLEPAQTPVTSNLTEKEDQRCALVPDITRQQKVLIIMMCVKMLSTNDKDLLHAILQISVRLTQNYELAKLFVQEGGIKQLLEMRRSCDISGLGVLATVIIRHCLEEPKTLAYAMEKVIRARTLPTIPPPYKDLIYLARQIGAAVARSPQTYLEVARNILRIDTSLYDKTDSLEGRLSVFSDPCIKTKAPALEEQIAVEVVYDLLTSLVEYLGPTPKKANTGEESTSKDQEESDEEEEIVEVVETSTSSKTGDQPVQEKKAPKKRLLLAKSFVIKILADAVVSYGPVAKLITEYVYKSQSMPYIKEDMTALALIFDKLLSETPNISDSECSTMCRALIASIAAANHSPEAQFALITEVKAALARALTLPESAEKHSQVQQICGVISTMIESCPPAHNVSRTQQPVQPNNIVKLMTKRGLVNDLARVPHFLDLSSPNFAFTVNAALKPLESISRSVNQAVSTSGQSKSKRSHPINAEENQSNSTATSTEGTNAQLDENAEGNESTDRDVSTVPSTMEHNPADGPSEEQVLEQIMGQFLDQELSITVNDNNQTFDETSGVPAMEIDDDCNLDFDHERDNTEELMSTDSGESDSNPSDQVEEEDNDGDDDNMDDNDDNTYDDESNDQRRPVSVNRDEGVLMIQYADHRSDNDNGPLPRMVRWNDNNVISMFDEANNSNDQSGPITHPLLMSNSSESTSGSIPRMQRTNRTRRYQYLFNSRNPNPPVILQRLLGPQDPPMNLGTGGHLGANQDMRESTRVVVMDNFSLLPPHEEQIDFVDQSGYLFGPSLAAALNHIPPVLNWWIIETRCLDMEAMYDYAIDVCNQLLPDLIKVRNNQLREKKMEVAEKFFKRKQKYSQPGTAGNTFTFVQSLNEEGGNQTGGTTQPPAADLLKNDDSGDPMAADELDEDIDGVPIDSSDTLNDPSDSDSNNRSFGNPGQEQSEVSSEGFDRSARETSQPAESRSDSQQTNREVGSSAQPQTVDRSSETERLELDDTIVHFDLSLMDPFHVRSRNTSAAYVEPGNPAPVPPVPENVPNDEPIFFEQQRDELFVDLSQRLGSPLATGTPSNSPPRETESGDQHVARPQQLSRENGQGLDVIMIEPSTSSIDRESGLEIPEGVDRSFLDALPPEMRREVLETHRILNLSERVVPRSAGNSGEASGSGSNAAAGMSTEVSPEFLAALPPALQEEVLTQQRLEQQRQAASRANPNEPVDASAFFETLQPSLRTMILADMEDSQMSALPPDLAAEAQTLRRDWEARNRHMVRERFLQSNLTTIIGHSTRGRFPSRPNNFLSQRTQWSTWINNTVSSNPNVKIKGKQLLDHEGLTCLLILLFTDDPHLNKLRLHRLIRNLCYHVPTREWIIQALVSIIDKSVYLIPDENLNKPSRRTPKPGPLSSKLMTDTKLLQNGGNWLNIHMEAALGCSANVFIINKAQGKKNDKLAPCGISIHPQAGPVICKNTLDLFVSLSRIFPTCFMPFKDKNEKEDKDRMPPVRLKIDSSSDFWDILLKLDSLNTKKGKSLVKSGSTSSSPPADTLQGNSGGNVCFDHSAFGHLINALSSPVISNNMHLTDGLLKLLSVITSSLPTAPKNQKGPRILKAVHKSEHVAPASALALGVNVLTHKSCSEEGLEHVTNLLLNMASTSLNMSHMILSLLLSSASRIGDVLRDQIQDMLKELNRLNVKGGKSTPEESPSTSKGTIANRFTKETVIITASSKVKTSCELQLPSMVPLTSKSSNQVFFLRVLRVIVQIRNAISHSVRKGETPPVACSLSALSDQLNNLKPLWETLSLCLLELEHTPDHHAVLVLQPAVEAFFLVHSPQQGATTPREPEEPLTSNTLAYLQPPAQPQASTQQSQNQPQAQQPAQSQSEVPSSSSSTPPNKFNNPEIENLDISRQQQAKNPVSPEQLKFLSFAEKHRTVLNQILRQSTAHLADGPFAVLVDHTRILDFDIKRRYFRTELERADQGIRREETAVHVRRNNIFEDSFRELYRRSPEEWKNRFYIVFEDEEGQDAGGLLREWYVIISRDIFNPMYALFTVSPGDRVTYMINSASHYNPNHLCYYKFVGRVIAKAIYDNKLLECYFTRSFYKHILGIPVKYTDMESEDYSFYRGLVYLMENNINNVGLDLTFSTEVNEFGVTETRDLIPNGRNVPVTEENKMEYVRLSCQMKMTGAIKQQLNAFLEGFYDIIPMRLIAIFNEQELELLISGLPNVDIDDLKANTEYHKYQANSLQIQWFWRALRSFDQADRAKFLQFVTGTSKVPLQGFAALEGMNGVQRFQIHRDDRSTDRLPSAHTCFNQLDLPVYETYDKLRSYLLKAIHECSEGFGFA